MHYKFIGDQDTITRADIENWMGLNDHDWSGAAAGWLDTFAAKSYITMGSRMHGDNAPRNWVSTLTNQGTDPAVTSVTLPGGPASLWYNAALVNPWARINMWAVVSIGAANTTTNAYIKLYDAQLYTLSSVSGRWTRQDNSNGRPKFGMDLYPLNAFTGGTAATAGYASDGKAGYPNYSGGAFKLLHNPLISMTTIDSPEDVSCIFATLKAELFVPSGAALNGVTEIMVGVGCDGSYNADGLGNGTMAGATYYPGLGGGASLAIPNDGSSVRVGFCTTTTANTGLGDASDSVWTDTPGNLPYLSMDEVEADLPVLLFN